MNAQKIRFRFGLTGRRWGLIGPVVLLLQAQEAPARFDHLIEPLVASGRQVVALDDPTQPSAARAARVSEFAAAINEAANEIDGLEAVFSEGLGSAAAAQALEHGLFVDHAVLMA